jgi:hypothetical protein
LHFRTQETNLLDIYEQLLLDDQDADGELDSTHQLAEVELTGTTTDGTAFEGEDTMNTFLSGKALRDLLDQLFGGGPS